MVTSVNGRSHLFCGVFLFFVVFTSIKLSLSQDASAIHVDTLSIAFSGLVLLPFHLAQAEVETLWDQLVMLWILLFDTIYFLDQAFGLSNLY